MIEKENVSLFVREIYEANDEVTIWHSHREWRPWVWVVLVTAMLWGLMKMWILATVMQYH